MDSNYYLYIILISFLVTYPIRAIPALFISKLSLSSYWQRVLDLVPYTALTLRSLLLFVKCLYQ